MVGDGEMASVLGTVAVGSTDEGSLPVVVEVVVGDGDEVTGMGDIEETVVVVFVVIHVRRKVIVVNPDITSFLNGYLSNIELASRRSSEAL